MSEGRKVASYKDLIVWQKAIALVKRVYEVTGVFPSDERFGLVSQMRRAAVSIPSNIAEGQARHTTGEYIHALSHAEGSLAELDTQLTLSIELKYCSQSTVADLFALLDEIRKMLNALRRSLQKSR